MNFFPYTNFWRLKGSQKASNRCSIIVSIVVIFILVALLVQRIIIVAKKETLTTSSQTIIDSFPPKYTVTSYQHEQAHAPFMIAIQDIDSTLVTGNLTYNFAIYSQLNGTIQVQNIPAQTCTAEHFSKFPAFKNSQSSNNLKCLPLNKTYQLFGSTLQSTQVRFISLRLVCQNCNNWSYTFVAYMLSAVINPDNGTNPQQYYLKQILIPIQIGNNAQEYNAYINYISQNVVTTDNSLMPWEDRKDYRSWISDELKLIAKSSVPKNGSSNSNYSIIFQRSTKTIYYKRSFYKILDAFSYIGGMFQVILGAFFFMAIVGRLFFETEFAKRHFKSKELEQFGFPDLLKQMFYRLCGSINCKLEWEVAEKRQKIINTVNNLMDVTYLQRRLNFFEKALSIVLEKHQFSSLFLCRPINEEVTDSIYKAHRFRDRFIRYLSLRSLQQGLCKFVSQNEIRKDAAESAANLVEGKLDQNIASKLSPVKDIEKLNKLQLGEGGENARHFKGMKALSKEDERIVTASKGSLSEFRNQLGKGERNQSYKSARTNAVSSDIVSFERQRKIGILQNGQKGRDFEEEQQKFREAVGGLDPMDMEDLDVPELEEWLQNDFRKLLADSNGIERDDVSKKIYSQMEEWLKNMLKDLLASKEFAPEGKRLSDESKQIYG